jgi:hypothetical protein
MAEPRPNVTIRVVHDIPALTAYVAFLSGQGEPTVLQTLSRIEEMMAKSFKKIMEEIATATQEIKDHRTAADAAEVQEDADAKARDEANAAKITEAEAKIAELQAKIDAGNLSEEQEAEATAAIAALRSAAGLTDPTVTEPDPATPPDESTEPGTPPTAEIEE